ncbi:MAG: hypothetical protein LBL86_11290 [Coriobacteriales bacterium]|nr:hypothetical protein [Coriobacteriales bacterium]
MKLEYILIPTDETDDEATAQTVRAFLKRRFRAVRVDTLDLEYRKKIISVPYTLRKSEGSASTRFHFSVELSNFQRDYQSRILSKVHSLVSEGERQHFYILLVRDDVSAYCAERIYPSLYQLESRVRSILYKLLTKALGRYWYAQEMPSKLKKNIQKKIKTSPKHSEEEVVVERALQELTFNELIEWLLRKSRENSPDKIIDDDLRDEIICNLSKEEIIEKVATAREKTLWSRYRADYFEIVGFEEKLGKLKDVRNAVCHCKFFHWDDLSSAKALFKEGDLLESLDKGIDKIDSEDMTAEFAADVLRDSALGLSGLSEMFSELLYPHAMKLSEILADAIGPITQNFTSDILQPIARPLSVAQTEQAEMLKSFLGAIMPKYNFTSAISSVTDFGIHEDIASQMLNLRGQSYANNMRTTISALPLKCSGLPSKDKGFAQIDNKHHVEEKDKD